MEFLIFIGIAWILISWLNRDSSEPKSTDKGAEHETNPKSRSSSDRERSNSKSKFDKEPNSIIIQRAIDSKKNLKFRYIDQEGEISHRNVSPINFETRHENQILCLVAYCHLRGAVRTFVVRRMQKIELV